MRRSRTCPERSLPTQVWQMPMRQPNGNSAAGLLAADEDRHADVARSPRTSVTRKLTVPPLPTSASPRPMIGWKRSMCRRAGSPCRLQCASIASIMSRGPERNVSRSRQSGQMSIEVGRRDPLALRR